METVIHQNSTVRILDYCCAGHLSGRGPEEESDCYQVVLPRAGVFVRHVHGESIVADPNHALFFNFGEIYRVSHPVKGGDRCTVLAYNSASVCDCVSHLNPAAITDEARLFTSTHTPTSADFDLLHRRLLGAVRQGCEPLAAEEVALDMLAGLISATSRCGTALPRANRQAATLRRHEQLVSAVKEELARRLGEKLCLASIAATVHVSPFHLSRVFRSTTGASLSSYHRRLRLRTALQRILDGEDDLTRLAVELGFSHHSHFSSAFGSEFGIPPSANRDQLSTTNLRNAATALRARVTAMKRNDTI